MEVQQNDIELDQLMTAAPTCRKSAELRAVESRLASTGEGPRRCGAGGRHWPTAKGHSSRDESLSSRIAAIESRLFHGDATAFHDQQAMADEVKSLEYRRRGLEDRESS